MLAGGGGTCQSLDIHPRSHPYTVSPISRSYPILSFIHIEGLPCFPPTHLIPPVTRHPILILDFYRIIFHLTPSLYWDCS